VIGPFDHIHTLGHYNASILNYHGVTCNVKYKCDPIQTRVVVGQTSPRFELCPALDEQPATSFPKLFGDYLILGIFLLEFSCSASSSAGQSSTQKERTNRAFVRVNTEQWTRLLE
jgi:hypothetical protein